MNVILLLEKISIKRLVARQILETILKVGWNVWDILFPPFKLQEYQDLK